MHWWSAEEELLISREEKNYWSDVRRNYWSAAEETIDQQTFSLINLPNILSHGTNKQTNNWRRGQIWQKAKIIDKQSNKQEARLTERLTLQNLCAAFRHNRARRRGKGDEPGRLEFWNKNNSHITFWLKEIAVVMMVMCQGACSLEKYMASI